MRCIRFLLLFFCYFAPQSVRAQTTISGVARDSLTRAPLGFASVFLANTTYGATTDAEGRFALSGVPVGRYDFVASYLGYRLYQQAITVRGPQTINPLLAPVSNQLRDVIVQARRHRNKLTDYQRFLKLFLGMSTFSQQCRIRDTQAVVVKYDAGRNLLTATSPDFVAVENRALGYLIKYYGLQFEADFNRQTVTFSGHPVFSVLPNTSPQREQRWQRNRKKAYLGSSAHFLRSVYNDQVKAQGYLVQRIRQVANNRRALADSLVKQQRALAGPGNPFVVSDSLQAVLTEPHFYRYLYAPLLPIDSLRQLRPDGTHWLQFQDELQVTYRDEWPDPRYRPIAPVGSAPPPPSAKQVSSLHMIQPTVQLLPNGQLVNPLAIFTEGYWGFEMMGEFLPFNYEPGPPSASGQKP